MACLYSEKSTLPSAGPANGKFFTHTFQSGGLNQISVSSRCSDVVSMATPSAAGGGRCFQIWGLAHLQPPDTGHIFSHFSDRLWVVCSLIKMRVIGPGK